MADLTSPLGEPARVPRVSAGHPAGDDDSWHPRCPRSCSECDGDHHFSDATVEFASNEPDHPAAKAGEVCWFECKHCDAWATFEDVGEDEE